MPGTHLETPASHSVQGHRPVCSLSELLPPGARRKAGLQCRPASGELPGLPEDRGCGARGGGPGLSRTASALCHRPSPGAAPATRGFPGPQGPLPAALRAGTCSAARWPLGSSWGSFPPPQSLPFPAHHPELAQVRGWRVCSSQDWGRESLEARTRRPRGGGRSMLGTSLPAPPSCGSRGPVWVWALLSEPCPRAWGS